MSLLGFTLVLTAAFCHAGWNFLVKRLHAGPELVWLFSVVTLAIYLPVAGWAVATAPPTQPLQWGFIAGSTLVHLAYFLLIQHGYRVGDLSVVYPVARATGPLLATVFAIVLLGERPTVQGLIGAGVIVTGVFMLTGGAATGLRARAASLGFGLATGVLIGSYTVWDAYAVATLAVHPVLLDYASTAGRCLLLAPMAARRRAGVAALWRDHRAAVIAIAALNPLAYILVLLALRFTPITLVAPLREVSVLIAVILGAVVLREGTLRARLPWAAVIVLGVVMLATSRAG